MQTVERYTFKAISLPKVVSDGVFVNNETSLLSLAIGRLMVGRYCCYKGNSFEQSKKGVIVVFKESLDRLKPDAQSLKNKKRCFYSKIALIARDAIAMNPFGRDTASIQDLLFSFVNFWGIQSVL